MPSELLSNVLDIALWVSLGLFVIGIAIIAYHFMRFGIGQPKDKKPYEHVLLFLHRHWFTLLLQLLAFAFIGLIPLAIYALLSYYALPTTHYAMLAFIFYLAWIYGVLYAILMYLLDIWIVTDHRIIDSEQHGFFNRTTAELHLAKIQDISVSVRGVIPTFLDYGDLEVQSAGASEKFFFKEIPHPNAVRELIMEAHNKFIEIHPNDVEVHEL